jgi:hypothetical protein
MRRTINHTIAQAEKAAEVEQLPKPGEMRNRFGIQYAIVDNGQDAYLKDGDHKDEKISDLVKSPSGRDYLGSIFHLAPKDLRVVIVRWFDT